MTIHYLDEDAVGTGDGASWANAFTTMDLVLSNINVVVGDTLYISHTTNDTYSVSKYFVLKDLMTLISVNKLTDQYQKGARLTTSSGLMSLQNTNADGGSHFIFGVDFSCEDDFYPCGTGGVKGYYEDSNFYLGPGAGDNFYVNLDGQTFVSKNCKIYLASLAASYIYVYGGAMFEATGLYVTTMASATHVFDIGTSGGATVKLTDCDLNNGILDISNAMFLNNSDADDVVEVTLVRCKLQGLNTFSYSTTRSNRYFYLYNCYWQSLIPYTVSLREGDCYTESSVYTLDNPATYSEFSYNDVENEYGQVDYDFSYYVTTNNYVKDFVNPFVVKIASLDVNLQQSKVFDFYVAQYLYPTKPENLNNKNIWIVASYLMPDVDEQRPELISTRATNILSDSHDYPNTLDKWNISVDEEEDSTNEQVISITIPAVPEMTTVRVVFTLYITKQFNTTSIDFYVSPKPTMSYA